MSQVAWSPLLLPLAFQVWDAFGWIGQVLFTLRVVDQWWASEKAKKSHVTPTYWWYSLAATPLVLVYVLYRKDPVFVIGFLVNGFLYARNLALFRKDPQAARKKSPWAPLIAGVGVFGVITFVSLAGKQVLVYDFPLPWLIVGFTGQVFWTSRFVIQWYLSEKHGRSILPASFFWFSLAGAVLLFSWAIYRVDWVMMAAYALNPIPYVRNLVLLGRERAGGPGEGHARTGRPGLPAEDR